MPAASFGTSPDKNFPSVKLGLSPTHWDLVFTCFEPVIHVTGGIGTYHRLLLNELADGGKNILVLTRTVNNEVRLPPNVAVIAVDEIKAPTPFNFVGGDHEQFSLGCHFVFRDLFRKGHRFGFVEFSDYGGDGFYALQARQSGVYDFDLVAVRLHSPHLMLVRDNGEDFARLSSFRRDQIDREIAVYEHADVVLYGGEAMAQRVASLCIEFGVDINGKLVKCPHPFEKEKFEDRKSKNIENKAREFIVFSVTKANPASSADKLRNAKFVSVIGRIEYRKGQLQFFTSVLSSKRLIQYIKQNNIHCLIAGRSVLEAHGYSLDDLKTRIEQAGLSGHVHFLGWIPQDKLPLLSLGSSGFVFPSVFENYPNALLEVLQYCRPIALSNQGCMPEITEGFSGVFHLDPRKFSDDVVIEFMNSLDVELPTGEFERRLEILTKRQTQIKEFYFGKTSIPLRSSQKTSLSLGIVIPVYNDHRFLRDSIRSSKQCLSPGDCLVVVDDGSNVESAANIKSITKSESVELVRLTRNVGPTLARLRGVESVQADLIQFCDADDMLEPTGVRLSRDMFSVDERLTFVCGVMFCFQDANHCWVPRNGHIWTAAQQNFAHAGSMVRREEVMKALTVSHDRLSLNEDWLFNLVLLARGGICKMLPEITYYYRRHNNTRSTQNQKIEQEINKRIKRVAWDQIDFTERRTTSRLRFMLNTEGGDSVLHERIESLTKEKSQLKWNLKRARHSPFKLMFDFWAYKTVHLFLSVLPLPEGSSVRFKKFAAKRNPGR
jgi:glycosyltransferase involved in cell wall biosynthesis